MAHGNHAGVVLGSGSGSGSTANVALGSVAGSGSLGFATFFAANASFVSAMGVAVNSFVVLGIAVLVTGFASGTSRVEGTLVDFDSTAFVAADIGLKTIAGATAVGVGLAAGATAVVVVVVVPNLATVGDSVALILNPAPRARRELGT